MTKRNPEKLEDTPIVGETPESTPEETITETVALVEDGSIEEVEPAPEGSIEVIESTGSNPVSEAFRTLTGLDNQPE